MKIINLRQAEEDDWENAMLLAWVTFLRFDAPDYTDEGINSFRDFVIDDTLKKMFLNGAYKLYIALDGEKIIGLISVRDLSHISLLFVDEDYHKMGIGRALIEFAKEQVQAETDEVRLTVNAAPYAYGFYHKLGFIDTDLELENNGIYFTPMELLF